MFVHFEWRKFSGTSFVLAFFGLTDLGPMLEISLSTPLELRCIPSETVRRLAYQLSPDACCHYRRDTTDSETLGSITGDIKQLLVIGN